MAQAKRDDNRVPAIQGVSSVDGETTLDVRVNPTNNRALVETTVTDSSGNNLSVNTDGSLNVVPNGSAVDSNNSSSTPLAGDGVFTGTATDVLHFSAITILVESDVASAADGMVVQFSEDASDWHDGEAYTIPAGSTKFFTPPVQSRYFRIVYTNGSSAQSEFHLHTVLKKQPVKWSSHNINSNLNDDDDAQLVASVLKLRTAQNNYVSGSSTNNGNFKVSLEEYDPSFDTAPFPVMYGDSMSLDAFGRVRSSEPTNRLDIEFIYDKQPLLVDEVTSGGATATHNANSRDVTLDIVETNSGTSAGLYSHIDIPYTPGNSQLIDITGTLDDSDIGGGTAQLFLRSTISGSTTETVVDQTNWNVNTVSDMDWTTSQILVMDFQSLKVGRIRYGFARNGVAVPVHIITNDNLRDSGYWQRPSLPTYWRIYNDSTYTYMEMGYGDTENAIGLRYRITANADATMRAICASVKSEGGDKLNEMPGLPFSIDNNITSKTVSTTLIPLISIRPKSTFNSLTNRGVFIPDGWEVQGTNALKLVILYRPTLTGASWTDVDTTNSGMEYDVTASAVSGGVIVDSAYLATSGINSRSKDEGLLGRTILSLGRTGTSDILTIAAIRTGAQDSTTYAGLNWKEIR